MAAQLSHVYPLGSRVTEAGHLELGGCDAIELAREFGTPAYVVVEDDVRDARAGLRRRLRRALRRLRGPLRLQGVPVHGGAAAPQRGGPGLRRRVGRRAAHRAQGRLRPGAHPPARQREVRGARSREALDAGVGHVVVDNHTDIDLLEEIVPDGRGAARCSCASRPAISPDTHPSISTGGPNTKFGFGLQSAPRRDRAPGRVATGSSSRACTCTSARRSTTSRAFRTGARGDRRRSATSHGMVNLGGGLGVAYVERRAPADDRGVRRGQGRRGARRHGPGRAHPRRARPRARRPTRPSRSTRCSRSSATSTSTSPSTAACPTTCARCSTARATRRRSPSRFGGGTHCHLVGKHCESGDLIVRDAELADPRRGRRRRHARRPAPTASRWPTPTTACRARPS